MCTGTMTLRPVSVWHVLPRAQLQSSRRAFATARRRRPGGSHLPGRATRTMRGGVSFAAAAASTAALGARRDGPARGTASSARHPKDAWPRARLGYRRRRTTGKVAAAASDDVLDEDDDSDDLVESVDDLDALFSMLAAQRRGEMLFAEEMRKPDAEVDFVRAAAFVAMHRRPELSRVEDAVEELDELAAELQKLLPPNEEDRFPLRTLKTISRFMFEDLGFRGDDETFYDPRNSCLDEVLARRVGIPITLSLIYMELAKRVGMPMVGVNLPSRFMIRPVVDEMEVLVDVFNKGEIVFVEDVEEMLGKFYSGAGNASGENGDDASAPSSGPSEDPPSVQITIDRAFFEDNSVRPKQFFTRMLTNLKQIYFNEEAYADALRVVGYQAHCAPTAEIERFNRRDGGICLFLMQRYDECVEELNGYLEDAAAAAAAEDAEAAATTSEEREALASRRAARDRDRAQVTRMVHTALEQSKRLAAEKAVTNVEGKEKDEGDDDRNRLDDAETKKNERKRKDAADLDDEAFRIVEDAARRADDREDEEKE